MIKRRITAGVICGGLAALIVLTGCPSSETSTSTAPVEEFRLTVAMLDLGLVTEFLPFGYTIEGRLNPCYEFRTPSANLAVFASAGGTVEAVDWNGGGSQDWEIRVRHPDHPEYLVIYDHVLDVVVTVGQSIEAGAPLGTIGRWAGGRGRTELQINVSRPESGEMHLCPRSIGSDDFNAAHDSAYARSGKGNSVCLLEEFPP